MITRFTYDPCTWQDRSPLQSGSCVAHFPVLVQVEKSVLSTAFLSETISNLHSFRLFSAQTRYIQTTSKTRPCFLGKDTKVIFLKNLVDFGIPLMYHIGVNDNQL